MVNFRAAHRKMVSEHLAGGVSSMKGDESMTAAETSRLIDWLTANGHSSEQAIQCIKYIAGTQEPAKPAEK